MSITWTNENLNDYLDDRLSPADRAELETIIRNDAVAVDSLRELRRMRIDLRKAPRFQLNKDFAARVVASLKQGDNPSLADPIAGNSGIATFATPPSSISVSSVSVTTWRAVAVAMTTIAASLLLIILVRPELPGRETVGQRPSADSTARDKYPGNAPNNSGSNGAPIETELELANRSVDDGADGSDSKTGFATDPRVSMGEPFEESGDSVPSRDQRANENDSSSETQLDGVANSGEANHAPSLPAPTEPADLMKKDLDIKADPEGRESVAQSEIAAAANKEEGAEPGDQFLADSSQLQFEEVVVVSTTRQQMEFVVGSLAKVSHKQEVVDDRLVPDGHIHSRTQKSLDGSDERSESVDNQLADAIVTHEPIVTYLSNQYLSIEATPDQLVALLEKIGAPSSRMVAQHPEQSMSINQFLSRDDSTTDDAPGAGAAGSGGGSVMNPAGVGLEEKGVGEIRATILEPVVPLQHQAESYRDRPEPVLPDAVDTSEAPAPAVRRYLIILEVTQPGATEPEK